MYRKNTASQFIHFQGVDSTTGGIKSGVTWTIRRCIDGTFAAATGTVTEDGTAGWYKLAMSQADTNGNNIGFNFTGTGAVPQTVNIITTAADPTDSVRFGLTALPNAAAAANGGLPTIGVTIPNATAGASGGIFIAGTNAPVTITGSGDALTISSTAGNGNGMNVSGNGSGHGVKYTGGATGNAETLIGGGTSGDGVNITTTVGHGMNIVATGTSKHGITATGGNAGTSDGIKGVAGAGGIDIRGNLTGNITGNLSGSVGSVTGAVGSVTGAVASVTAGVTVTTNNDKTGYTASTVQDKTGYGITSNIKKNQALNNFSFLITDSTTHAPKTGAVIGTVTRSIDGGAFAVGTLSVVTEVGAGIYVVNFGAGDLNGNVIVLRVTATSSDDVLERITTQP